MNTSTSRLIYKKALGEYRRQPSRRASFPKSRSWHLITCKIHYIKF